MTDQLLLGKRVLIADDDAFSRKIVTGMIEKLGCSHPIMVGCGDTAEQSF